MAIKQIDTKFIEQQDKYIKQQIFNEIEILKKCNHPNIVRFIDLIETDKFIYIVIEFCKNGDLKELLSNKRLTEIEGTKCGSTSLSNPLPNRRRVQGAPAARDHPPRPEAGQHPHR